MLLRVEFFGIPRLRTGLAETTVELSGESGRLRDVLAALAARFPDLADCVEEGQLRKGMAANVGGQRFVSDPNTELHAGDCLLLFSGDGGG